ncbi:MAG: excinuclease ABC subunit UvrC [Acidobacteriota bacterium]|nr:excinuclease ABC subunit UvrC [Acidobacteriota bacterium]
MPISDLKAQINRLPQQPGVYLFLGRGGETLYVGKARTLRDRARSYLGAYGTSPRHDALLDEADTLDFIVTDSVVEALALENNLIKQRAPRYNILLRDDKTYPYLRLTVSEPAPRVLVARQVERDGDMYAGPFMPAQLARRAMSLSHRVFGIRSCNEIIDGKRGRPCLEYDIKRCLAPCVAEICGPEEYRDAVDRTRLFLEGRNDELVARLRREMGEAAEGERYEKAAHLRDAVKTLETLKARQQKMATTGQSDRDAFGLKVGPSGAVVQIFQMRNGKVIEKTELIYEGSAETDAPEVLAAALQQFYEEREAPPEIHIAEPVSPADAEALEGWLSVNAGRRVRIIVPRRGDKRGLLELASRNAAVAYQTRFNQPAMGSYDALETLRQAFGLAALPRRIECFDISTIQGSETVASMVVCEDGRMRRSEYRKFRIRGTADAGATPVDGAAIRDGFGVILDDFASMREVVFRRYRKVLEAGGPFPDLVLIDGGKGQLNAAYDALRELGLGNLVAAGIAKKEELLFVRGQDDPIALPPTSPALLLIQRIRDEAHRFALTFHRARRTKRDLTSELEEIPGIGPGRRRVLLRAFGSLSGVRKATREELTRVVGPRGADAILSFFANA